MNFHTRGVATEDAANANLPVPQASITEICKHRDETIRLHKEAQDLLEQAAEARIRMTSGVDTFRDKYEENSRRERYEKTLRDYRIAVDHAGWQHIMDRTDFHRLMDAKAKQDFFEQSQKNPPEFTPENVMSTLRALVGDSDKIFRRGLVESFKGLDRRFKSNSAFRVRKRMILTHMFNEWGTLNYRMGDQLIDIERVFAVLDGKPARGNAGIIAQVRMERRGIEPQQSTHESDYMRVECYKNGNMHLWFTREDLLLKINRMIAEEYGVVLPDDRQTEEDLFKRGPKGGKEDFFPTPPAVVAEIVKRCPITKTYPRKRVLEPSAGTGNIVSGILKAYGGWHDVTIVAYELDEDRFYALDKKFTGRTGESDCYHQDFLTVTPPADPKEQFDVVAMNPPFSSQQDIYHVMHAAKFLKKGGRLVSVMAASVKTRDNKLTTDFRAFVKSKGGTIEDLPEGSFKHAKTNVATVLVSFNV